VFDGHSLVFDGQGRVVARAHAFAEDLLVYDLPAAALADRTGLAGPVGEIREVAEDIDAQALAALELGLRDYAHKCGFERVLLGLSGGIDSALVAAIAARALGPGNVLGVTLPTRYSSAASVTDSRALAERLGIDFRIIPIDDIFQSHLERLARSSRASTRTSRGEHPGQDPRHRADGPVQQVQPPAAGGRQQVGSSRSATPPSTATCAAAWPDLRRAQDPGLPARPARQRERELIPGAILEKAPSAELRPDQTDQDTLPPYDQLDRVLELYVERHLSPRQIVDGGIDPRSSTRSSGSSTAASTSAARPPQGSRSPARRSASAGATRSLRLPLPPPGLRRKPGNVAATSRAQEGSAPRPRYPVADRGGDRAWPRWCWWRWWYWWRRR